MGRPTGTINPDGTRTTTTYDGAGQVVTTSDVYGNVTTYLYDAVGRQTTVIDPLGNRTTTVYNVFGNVGATVDEFGNRTSYVYDSNNRLTGTEDYLGHWTTTVYDAAGEVIATVDEYGSRTSFTYDANGREIGTLDTYGNRTTNVYNAGGQLIASVDQYGNRTSYTYDSTGAQVSTEDQYGHFTTTVYDVAGNTIAQVDDLGNTTSFIYDAYGRQVATEDTYGHFTTTVYDAYGRVSANVNVLGNAVTTLYDAYGRPQATVDALGSLGHFATTIYDAYGRALASEDSLGHYTTTVFDVYGRQVATIDPLGNRTTMVLDSFGRQVNEIDADGNVTTFVYDALNRVVQEITPTGGSTTMAYDADGRLTAETDALGRQITYSFDADGNNIGQTWHNADSSTSYVTFTYDANGNQLTAANSVGTYTMTYDATGETSTVQGPWGVALTFTYDSAGNRTKIQDSFGGVTTNTYDANGNLTQQLFGGTGLTPMRINQSYDADNELTGTTRYSDLAGTTIVATSSYVYDAVGDRTGQTDKSGATTIANYTNVYDADGEITSEQINGGTPTSYTYDADGELTGDGTSSPTYDAEGNRTNTGYSTGTGNELESDGTWNYTYDAAGNETMKVAISGGETWTYGYDNKNELVKAQLWASDPLTYGTGDPLLKEVDYKYDVWGNLAERDDYPTGSGSATVTRYAVDGWNPALAGSTGDSKYNVWADLSSSNSLLTRYLHGDQLDQLFARQDAGVQYWYLTDYQGSVRDVLDNSGNVKDAIVYDGFGNVISETNSAYRGSYAWTGRMFDVETDLQYNRARWYDPATGRWQSPDPDGFDAGDSNLYRYANCRPTTGGDPSGLSITFDINVDVKRPIAYPVVSYTGGGHLWGVTWQLSNGNHIGGWIIQEVSKYTTTTPYPDAGLGDWQEQNHYWEVWDVPAGSVYTDWQAQLKANPNIKEVVKGWVLGILVKLRNNWPKGETSPLLTQLNAYIADPSPLLQCDDFFASPPATDNSIRGIKRVGTVTFVEKLNATDTLPKGFFKVGAVAEAVELPSAPYSAANATALNTWMQKRTYTFPLPHILGYQWKSKYDPNYYKTMFPPS